MTSRELVQKALRFQRTDRIAMSLPPPYPDDLLVCWPASPAHDASQGPVRDEWGSLWATVSVGSFGEVVEPAIPDWDEHPHFRVPPINAAERYESSAKAIEQNRGEKYVVGVLPVSLFAQVHHIRGLNNVLADFHLHPDRLARLVDEMVELSIESADRYGQIGADGVMLYDDWGLQDRLMISPRLWRQFYKPRYARLWQHAHAKGMTNWLHSCGKIDDVLDDMIDAGLDVIQIDQQMNMGLESLGERFAGRLTFWCPVDIQAAMPSNDAARIERYVHRMIRAFVRNGGGFIAKWYPSPLAAGHTEESIKAMCEAFVRYGSSS